MAKIVYGYTIPESLRWEGGPEKFGLQLLTADQELTASKIGRFDTMKIQYEAAKMAICEVDGKAVNNAAGEVDMLWERFGPKLRSLALQAYNEISTATDEESNDFFKSRTTKAA